MAIPVGWERNCRAIKFAPENDNNNTAFPRRTKKVKFSRPLEYCRIYDKETGQMSELKDSKLEGRKTRQYRMVSGNCNTSASQIARKEGRKTQSIVHVVQAFQKQQTKQVAVNWSKNAACHRLTGSKRKDKILPHLSNRHNGATPSNNRKIYDERLLPVDYNVVAHTLWPKHCGKNGFSPAGIWHTPYIQQLFD